MTALSTSQGIGDSFSYPFEDPQWAQKLLIALLLVLANFIVPIIPALFLAGYGLEIMRGIVLGDGKPSLPAWVDWGRLFVDGAKIFGIGLLYMLPVILFSLLGFGLILLPTMLVGLITSGGEEISNLVVLIPLLGSIGGVIVLGLAILFSIVLGLALPLAYVHFAIQGKFAAAFHINEWWQVARANFTDFLIAYAIILVFSILSGIIMQLLSLTVILCLLIPILQSMVTVYSLLIYTSLFAQAYRTGLEKIENQP
jgi:hypothetical protein